MTTRRHALKMLGTIGLTCAYPFAGDELYGQHVRVAFGQAAAGPYAPAFFTPSEYAAVSRLADVIIPPTESPGAVGAGVPAYIDRVVALNAEHQPLMREGLAWLEREAQSRFSKGFLDLSEDEHAAILQPLSDEVDRRQREAQQRRFRGEGSARVYHVAVTDRTPPTPAATPARPAVAADAEREMPIRLFRLVKNLTADGYYTSRAGLLEELGYKGNTALAAFPACAAVPEH